MYNPNELLRTIRDALADLQNDPDNEFAQLALRNSIDDLDTHLSDGGHLPLAWTTVQ